MLYLSPQDCKKELKTLNLTTNPGTDSKLVNFQVFPDSAQGDKLEKYQGHTRLDTKFPFHGAKQRRPPLGINNLSKWEADTKNKGHQEIMFFDWKTKLEKIQLTRDLKDDTKLYQGIRTSCKNDQGNCDPTTRTQAAVVWFPEKKLYHFLSSKNTRKNDKISQKRFYRINTI